MKEVTKWWAAADKTGRVFAHPTMPKRNETSGLWTNEKEFYKFLGLNTEVSTHGELDLKWEDEPVEVEVTFTLKEKLPTHTDTPLEERKGLAFIDTVTNVVLTQQLSTLIPSVMGIVNGLKIGKTKMNKFLEILFKVLLTICLICICIAGNFIIWSIDIPIFKWSVLIAFNSALIAILVFMLQD